MKSAKAWFSLAWVSLAWVKYGFLSLGLVGPALPALAQGKDSLISVPDA